MPPYTLQDFYFREARRLRFAARSAFKLLEIQRRHAVIPRGGQVLDLGAAPGAWTQVACQALGPFSLGGTVVSIDIKDFPVPKEYCDSRVRAIRADIFDIECHYLKKLSAEGFTTVLSDMCPSTSGVDFKDVALSTALATRALELAVGDRLLTELETEIETETELRTGTRAGTRTGTGTETEDEFGAGSGTDSREMERHEGVLKEGGAFVVKMLEGAGTQEFAQQCKKVFKSVSWVRPKASRAASREVYLVGKNKL